MRGYSYKSGVFALGILHFSQPVSSQLPLLPKPTRTSAVTFSLAGVVSQLREASLTTSLSKHLVPKMLFPYPGLLCFKFAMLMYC